MSNHRLHKTPRTVCTADTPHFALKYTSLEESEKLPKLDRTEKPSIDQSMMFWEFRWGYEP